MIPMQGSRYRDEMEHDLVAGFWYLMMFFYGSGALVMLRMLEREIAGVS